jgi:hypothetical protein
VFAGVEGWVVDLQKVHLVLVLPLGSGVKCYLKEKVMISETVQVETKSGTSWYEGNLADDPTKMIRPQLAVDMAEASSPNWRADTLDESSKEAAGKDLRSD